MEAANKNYVDNSIAAHAANVNLHLTSAQNTLLDNITVSSTEINQLSGISSNIQTQINTKFDKAGGLITGNVTLDTSLTNTGVTAGSYTKVTVDAKGRVTAGVNPTTLAGYGITDVYTKTETDTLIANLQAQIQELHLYIMSKL
jgi:phage-related tail fiber protein